MGYKKILLVIIPLLLIIAGVIYSIRFFTTLGTSIFYFSLASSLSLFILYFLHEEVFNSWRRFAQWYLLLSAVYIILPEKQHSGWLTDPFNDSVLIFFLAVLFCIISFGIFVIKSWKLRAKNQVG